MPQILATTGKVDKVTLGLKTKVTVIFAADRAPSQRNEGSENCQTTSSAIVPMMNALLMVSGAMTLLRLY